MPACVVLAGVTLMIKVQGQKCYYMQFLIVTACNIVCQT